MKIYNYIKLVIYLAFALTIILLDKELLLNYLQYLISSLMIAYGVENILLIGFTKKKECITDMKFLYGFTELLIGLVMITSISEFSHICIIWAVWALVRELFEIYEILNKKIKGVAAFIDGIESIVSIVFCVFLLINPSREHAKTHIYLLIVEILLTSLTPVLSELFYTYKKKRSKKQ